MLYEVITPIRRPVTSIKTRALTEGSRKLERGRQPPAPGAIAERSGHIVATFSYSGMIASLSTNIRAKIV